MRVRKREALQESQPLDEFARVRYVLGDYAAHRLRSNCELPITRDQFWAGGRRRGLTASAFRTDVWVIIVSK